MPDKDQSSVIDFLSQPECYGGLTEPVKKIETHISVIFLAGETVYKLKRAVKYPYLNFSTLEKRRCFCEAEVAVNRRTAPKLYKGVIPVTFSEKTGYQIGGEGEIVEWLVEMARFDENTLFDRLGAEGKFGRHLMADLAEEIANFHMKAEQRPNADSYLGLLTTITGNAETFSEFGDGILKMGESEALCDAHLAILKGEIGDLVKSRRKAGFVRHCHGDLHLRNICLMDGEPTLFDAIEFNETFSHIDVIYDLAFLLMDLEYGGHRRFANIILNRYLDITGDLEGLGCLPLFQSLRAAIRAHVAATTAHQHSKADKKDYFSLEAQAYLKLAQDYLVQTKPRLVAVGGLSGSGKSRLGRELGPFIGAAPGARIARSDVLRKRIAGVDPLVRLNAEGYSPDMTRRTYDAVYEETQKALCQGHSVVADAVFARPEERQAIADIAHRMNVPFDGVWLEASAEVMENRVTKRKLNPSDADASVVRMQQSYDLGDINWTRIDSSGPKPATLRKGLKTLGLSVVMGGEKGA